MADAYKVLYQGQVGNSMATVYTVPGATSVIVRHMVATNTSGSARTFGMCVGGTAAANRILSDVTLAANGGRAEWAGAMALDTGKTIASGSDGATAVTLTITGDEIT